MEITDKNILLIQLDTDKIYRLSSLDAYSGSNEKLTFDFLNTEIANNKAAAEEAEAERLEAAKAARNNRDIISGLIQNIFRENKPESWEAFQSALFSHALRMERYGENVFITSQKTGDRYNLSHLELGADFSETLSFGYFDLKIKENKAEAEATPKKWVINPFTELHYMDVNALLELKDKGTVERFLIKYFPDIIVDHYKSSGFAFQKKDDPETAKYIRMMEKCISDAPTFKAHLKKVVKDGHYHEYREFLDERFAPGQLKDGKLTMNHFNYALRNLVPNNALELFRNMGASKEQMAAFEAGYAASPENILRFPLQEEVAEEEFISKANHFVDTVNHSGKQEKFISLLRMEFRKFSLGEDDEKSMRNQITR